MFDLVGSFLGDTTTKTFCGILLWWVVFLGEVAEIAGSGFCFDEGDTEGIGRSVRFEESLHLNFDLLLGLLPSQFA